NRRMQYAAIAVALAAIILLPFILISALILLVEPPTVSDGYVEAVAGEPPLLNPVLAPYTLAGQDVLPLLFAGLMRGDASGNVEPDLAESLDAEADGAAYLVRLRPNLLWDDGVPLTAADV